MKAAAIVARTCRYCGCWPCRCGIDAEDGSMPPFALRIEKCVCHGPAIAAGGDPRNVAAAVRAHNETPEHESWRSRREGSLSTGDPQPPVVPIAD